HRIMSLHSHLDFCRFAPASNKVYDLVSDRQKGREGQMPAIVAIPQVVEELLVQFGDLFPNAPSRRHFAEYLTGLLVAEHKTVSGIPREFAATIAQSCLNRWLTEAPWEPDRINAHRLEWLQHDPATR